jgi:hypothetical protein
MDGDPIAALFHIDPWEGAEQFTGPTLMVSGFAFDGIGNRALLRYGQLQRKVRVAEPGDPR